MTGTKKTAVFSHSSMRALVINWRGCESDREKSLKLTDIVSFLDFYLDCKKALKLGTMPHPPPPVQNQFVSRFVHLY